MAGFARTLRQLAHGLYSDEPLIQKGRASIPLLPQGWGAGEVLHNCTSPYSLSRKHDDALKIAHMGRPGAMPMASNEVPVMWHRSGTPSHSSVTS